MILKDIFTEKNKFLEFKHKYNIMKKDKVLVYISILVYSLIVLIWTQNCLVVWTIYPQLLKLSQPSSVRDFARAFEKVTPRRSHVPTSKIGLITKNTLCLQSPVLKPILILL
jgi:hypothetical protein